MPIYVFQSKQWVASTNFQVFESMNSIFYLAHESKRMGFGISCIDNELMVLRAPGIFVGNLGVSNKASYVTRETSAMLLYAWAELTYTFDGGDDAPLLTNMTFSTPK